MLASTPVDGGHYFIDVIAGIAVAVAAILAARWICQAVMLRHHAFAPAKFIGAAVPAE
jgi:membrane-associated phospholipid phosphatase